jgi:glutathione peroxidase
LKSKKTGLLGFDAIKWNFSKFLIDRQGEVVERYAPSTSPESISTDIETYLAKQS